MFLGQIQDKDSQEGGGVGVEAACCLNRTGSFSSNLMTTLLSNQTSAA